MRQAELTVMLPPAQADTIGNIVARTYPITISPKGGTDLIRLDGVSIAPVAGIAEVWVNGAGSNRRQVVERKTAIPQATGSPFRPMQLTLVNLNTEASVQLVIELTVAGPVAGLGGAARFIGPNPEGTDGQAETLDDTAGDQYVACQGPGFDAWMTTNGPTVTRTIRDIIGRTRVLAPTGTGTIPTGEGSTVTIVLKKDGVVLEASMDTLDIDSDAFSMDAPTSGTIRLLGLSADAVGTAAIQDAAITAAKLALSPNIDPRVAGITALLNTGVTLGSVQWAGLAAGTYTVVGLASVGAEGSGGLVDVDIALTITGTANWAWDRVRYESGVDSSHLVIGVGTYVHAGGNFDMSCQANYVSGATFFSKNGYLLGIIQRTA